MQVRTVRGTMQVGMSADRRERRVPSVGHETAVICQVQRCLTGQRLVNQTYHFELYTLMDGWPMEFV